MGYEFFFATSRKASLTRNQLGLGQQPRESGVLLAQSSESRGDVGVEPTVGATPVVQRCR